MKNNKKKVLFLFGTRPEGIKMAPLIRCMQKDPAIEVITCITGQHREMLNQVLEFFAIVPDIDLKLMKDGQTLSRLTAAIISSLDNVLEDGIDYVVVQGDTTTAMAGALAAFYKKIKVVHVEAGLRSFDKYSPFPEEMNRVLIGRLATIHLAPTQASMNYLLDEGVAPDTVYNVGNTVIDALIQGLENLENDKAGYQEKFDFLDIQKRMILVTAHRRENFGEPIERICEAIIKIAAERPDVEFVYPVHLNPNVQEPVYRMLSGIKNVHLLDVLDYPSMLYLMNRATLILTDSGGIQEEAPSLGKPVLVLRDVTERMEGVEAGTAILVGTAVDRILDELNRLLDDADYFQQIAQTANPYGDGKTSERILEIIKND